MQVQLQATSDELHVSKSTERRLSEEAVDSRLEIEQLSRQLADAEVQLDLLRVEAETLASDVAAKILELATLSSRVADLERELAVRRSHVDVAPAARAAAGGPIVDRDLLALAHLQSSRDVVVDELRSSIARLESDASLRDKERLSLDQRVSDLTRELSVIRAEERNSSNMEYAKNVVVQFLCTSMDDARVRMLPALATVLHFSAKDCAEVQRVVPRCPRLASAT